MGFLFVYFISNSLIISEHIHDIFYLKTYLAVITITQTKCLLKVMNKYIKKSYCKNCGSANDWVNDKKTHLLEKAEFCSSCGGNLITGEMPKRKTKAKQKRRNKSELVISKEIPPLELDEEHCFFAPKKSQSLGKLIEPVEKEPEDPEDG